MLHLCLAIEFLSRDVEILALSNARWEKVQSRQHHPLKVFPYGPNADEVMLYGTVDYVLKDGVKKSVDWAARAHLVKNEGVVKMDFYQVYLVCFPLSFSQSRTRCPQLTKWNLGHGSVKSAPSKQ